MNIVCIEDFKIEVEKLCKKNSYANLEKDLIEYFFDKPIEDLANGVRLNGSDSNQPPFIKKRLNGSGGYRIYYLLIIIKDNICLVYTHPKTGSLGRENITTEEKADLLAKAHQAIKDDNLYWVKKDGDKKKLIFEKKKVLNKATKAK